MRFSSTLVLVTAGYVAAQTSCAAQNVLEACLGTTQSQLTACTPNDWQCLCAAQNAVLTCYNNCPSDPDRVGASNTQVSYCNAASLQSSQSVAASGTPQTSSSSSPAMAGVTSTMATATATGSSTSSSSTGAFSTGSSKSGAAGALLAPVGGLVAVVIGVVGLL